MNATAWKELSHDCCAGRRVIRSVRRFLLCKQMVELECKKVVFHSPQDEAAFFTWAKSIPSVAAIAGRGHSIFLRMKSKRVSEASLRELIALHHRYRVSMSQLAQFRNATNEAWFASPKAYWFRLVFGGTPNRS
jgi:hypothetical protein